MVAPSRAEGYVPEEDRIVGVDYGADGLPWSCPCGQSSVTRPIYGFLWRTPDCILPQTHAICRGCGYELTLTRPPFGDPVVRLAAQVAGGGGGE